MIIARIKQGLRFIFSKYDNDNDRIVRRVLSDEEFEIFSKMGEYDKVHSFRLYQLVEKDEILKELPIYKKLALLHDCGKENPSLFKRVKKVLIGDKILDNHSLSSYEKLKNINLELGELAKIHHEKSDNIYMKRFQELDDK